MVADAVLKAAANAGWMTWMQNGTAVVSGAIVSALGVESTVTGCTIVAGDSVVTVSEACVPVSAMAVGIALLVGSSRVPRTRLAAWLAVLVVSVAAANIARVVIVALLAAGHSPIMESVHVSVLPVVLALVAVGVWMLAERNGRG